MTTLAALIEAVRDAAHTITEIDANTDPDGSKFELANDAMSRAEGALLIYVIAHADGLAERERLERAALTEYRAQHTFGPAYYELIKFLDAHAGADA